MECCYGDACEHLPVALVKYKYCDGELHHICQTKYEFTYGLNSDMVYICRPCIDKKYRDIIEKAKQQADDETDSDGTVDLCGDNNGNNEAAANAVEVIDGANGAGVVATETTDNIIASNTEAAGEETTNDIITSDKKQRVRRRLTILYKLQQHHQCPIKVQGGKQNDRGLHATRARTQRRRSAQTARREHK